MIYLIEVESLSSAGIVETRYFCTGPGYVSRPADDPGNTVYENRVLNPGVYERHLWQPGQTQGGGVVTTGYIELANLDGGLDEWLDRDFDGRAVRILRGEQTAARSTFTTYLTGTTESVSLSFERVQINLRDRMAEVAGIPLTTARFGGTNVLPNGVDGTEELEGKYLPLVLGDDLNVSPPRCNSSKLIYCLSVRGIQTLYAVYEGGLAWTPGTLRASTAALEASAPAADEYDWTVGDALTPAYIRLGTSPVLDITVDVAEGATAADRTIAQIARRILTAIGIPASQTQRIAAFDTKNRAGIGLYIGTDGATAGAALDAVCESAGAAWTVRRDGTFELLRLEEPNAPPVAAITWDQILGVPTLAPTNDTKNGVPAYEIDLSYAHNYTVMTGAQVVGAVSDAVRDSLAKEYRQTVAKNLTIWNPETKTGRNPLSGPLAVRTQFLALADADAEAARRAALYGQWRRYVSIMVALELTGGIELGDVITVTMPRFGCDAGVAHLVVGMVENHASETTELFLWR